MLHIKIQSRDNTIYLHISCIFSFRTHYWSYLFILGLCHKQQCTGYRHYSNSFRDSLRVRDIEECSNRCASSSYCNTFSFKHYGSVESRLEVNCLLSSFSSLRLDATEDLSLDINWNLYRKIENAQCNNNGNDRHDDNYGRGNMNLFQACVIESDKVLVKTNKSLPWPRQKRLRILCTLVW